MNGTLAFWGCLCALAAPDAAGPGSKEAAPRIVIRLNEGKAGTTVDVTGLGKETLAGLARLAPDAEKWGRVLAVYVQRPGKGREGQPAVLGNYRIEKDVLRFEPRFPLLRGITYRAVCIPAGSKPIEVALLLPKPASSPTAVVRHVYPSGDVVPENLLKFYLHFSAPMSQGGSFRHIKLLDARGKQIDLPFLELDQELWDPTGTRFTVFFDPGRIKRGLKPREEVGPALEEGKRYTLVIDRGWADAEGNPLKETYRKTFTVTAPDDTPPDTKTWKLRPPTAGTRATMRVTFPEPMDHALLHRMVWVEDAAGKMVAGKPEVMERETVWVFTPAGPWRPGAYNLVADTRLEDRAGNSIGRPFEVDVFRPIERKIKTETVKVPFRISAK